MNDNFFCCGRPFTSSQALFPDLTDYAIIHLSVQNCLKGIPQVKVCNRVYCKFCLTS